MKQQNKYLVMFVVSWLFALAMAFLSDLYHPILIGWFLGCALAYYAVVGYVDSRHGENSSEMIDRFGALWGLRRRFLGLEHDSAYKRRITKKVCDRSGQ